MNPASIVCGSVCALLLVFGSALSKHASILHGCAGVALEQAKQRADDPLYLRIIAHALWARKGAECLLIAAGVFGYAAYTFWGQP